MDDFIDVPHEDIISTLGASFLQLIPLQTEALLYICTTMSSKELILWYS